MQQKQILTDDRIRISYMLSKSPIRASSCIVFLHGAGSNHTAWHHVIKSLPHYNMILPDIRGHGNSASGKLEAMTIRAHARDIKAIIDNEKLSKVVLIGNCFGSSIAREFTRLFPEHVDKLVMINLFSKRFLWLSSLCNAMNNVAYMLMKPLRMRKKLNFQDYGKERNKYSLNSLISDIKGTHIHVYSRAIKELFRYRLKLEKIAVPTLILQGKQDLLAKNAKIYKIVKNMQNISLRMVNTHHLILSNAPETCAEYIGNFILNNQV